MIKREGIVQPDFFDISSPVEAKVAGESPEYKQVVTPQDGSFDRGDDWLDKVKAASAVDFDKAAEDFKQFQKEKQLKTEKPVKNTEDKKDPINNKSEPEHDTKGIKKRLKAKAGDSELEIDVDAKFKHVVDGSEIEVELQELLNNYSGKQAYDKKFSQLDNDKKSFYKERDSVNAYLKEFATRAKTDAVGAFEYLAEVVGQDPLQFRREMRKQMLEKSKQFNSLNENDLKRYEMEEELNYLKQVKERESKHQSQKQAEMELQQKIDDSMKQHNISEPRLNELIADIEKGAGKQHVNLENIIALHNSYLRQDRVSDVLKKLSPEWEQDDQKFQTLESLLAGNSNLSDEHLEDYAQKLWGQKQKKQLESLVSKASKVSEESHKPKSSKVDLRSADLDSFLNF